MKLRTVVFLICIVIAILIVVATQGCASDEHRRELLQSQHPECFVMEDLTIECPNPFTDSSAGFGTEIKNEKIRKKTKQRK